jgi:hypothetical protein
VARNKKNPSKKASRNVLVVAQKVSKGRGKNKHEEIKAKRGKLGTRLYCIAISPVAKVKGGRKQAKFECFGSWEAAQVGLLARGPSAIPAPGANKALQAMLAMQEGGVSGRRRGLRGLRGTPEEHRIRAANAALVHRYFEQALDREDLSDADAAILRPASFLTRQIRSDNSRWADPTETEQLLEARDIWGSIRGSEADALERLVPDAPGLREALEDARSAGVLPSNRPRRRR